LHRHIVYSQYETYNCKKTSSVPQITIHVSATYVDNDHLHRGIYQSLFMCSPCSKKCPNNKSLQRKSLHEQDRGRARHLQYPHNKQYTKWHNKITMEDGDFQQSLAVRYNYFFFCSFLIMHISSELSTIVHELNRWLIVQIFLAGSQTLDLDIVESWHATH